MKKQQPTHPSPESRPGPGVSRRHVLVAGAAVGAGAALPFGPNTRRVAAQSAPARGAAPFAVEAFGAESIRGSIVPLTIERRALRPNDVLIDVLYAGICHSDIHAVDADWGAVPLPIVPGHEIVGRVAAVGAEVETLSVGDAVGVGCMVDACLSCAHCDADREQNCLNGTTFTYGARDRVSGGHTYGGYSRSMVVQEHFVLPIPDGMDLSRVAPILCAGITTFSPMQHWDVEAGQHVGVVGIGGLGHMAVKLAVARGARVTAFTTSPNKQEEIRAMGAEPVLWSDEEAFGTLRGSIDLLIATVPTPFEVQPFLDLLRLDATLVNVGQLGTVDGLSGMRMGFGRHSFAGSMIGGIAETHEVLRYCADHDILPDVELIQPSEIDAAFARVKDKDIKFRFVIDMNG